MAMIERAELNIFMLWTKAGYFSIPFTLVDKTEGNIKADVCL